MMRNSARPTFLRSLNINPPHEHYIPIAANFSNLRSSTKIITSTVPTDIQRLNNVAKNAFDYGAKYTYSYEVNKVASEIFSIWNES